MSAKSQLFNWLEADELNRVLRGLKVLAQQHNDQDLATFTLHQYARYNRTTKDRNNNLISQSSFQQEIARIREALVMHCQTLPPEWESSPLAHLIEEEKKDRKIEKKSNWKHIGITIIAIIGILVAVSKFNVNTIVQDLFLASKKVETLPQEALAVDTVYFEKPNQSTDTLDRSTHGSQLQIPSTTTKVQKKITQPQTINLTIQAKTNKGRVNLHYKAGEWWRLYVQANQPCQLRVIYRLADGRLVLLVDDKTLSATETGRWIDITGEYEVSEPYGIEAFYIFGQTKAFGPLQTVYEPDGYTRITEGLPVALHKIRGFKQITSYSEDSLQLHTHTPF